MAKYTDIDLIGDVGHGWMPFSPVTIPYLGLAMSGTAGGVES